MLSGCICKVSLASLVEAAGEAGVDVMSDDSRGVHFPDKPFWTAQGKMSETWAKPAAVKEGKPVQSAWTQLTANYSAPHVYL